MTLNFTCPVPDSFDSSITPPPLDRGLTHQAHATENLHGRIRDLGKGFRCEQLRLGRICVDVRPLVDSICRAKREQVSSINGYLAVSELEANPLEVADGLTELLAISGPGQGSLEYTL